MKKIHAKPSDFESPANTNEDIDQVFYTVIRRWKYWTHTQRSHFLTRLSNARLDGIMMKVQQ